MIKCPDCKEKNHSVSVMEMKEWKQTTVNFTCAYCDYESSLPASEYAPYMELDKNGC